MDLLPGLPRDQRNAIAARAYERFGDMPIESRDPIVFSRMIVGNLCVLTFRYTNGFIPPNPQQRDVFTALGGGYAQSHVLVSVVRVMHKLSLDEMEVELEQPVCMSYKNGPTVASTRFVLHSDGHVKYFPDSSTNETRDWSSFQPRWEHTRYPVLPVVVSGCDVKLVADGDHDAASVGGVKRRRHS